MHADQRKKRTEAASRPAASRHRRVAPAATTRLLRQHLRAAPPVVWWACGDKKKDQSADFCAVTKARACSAMLLVLLHCTPSGMAPGMCMVPQTHPKSFITSACWSSIN